MGQPIVLPAGSVIEERDGWDGLTLLWRARVGAYARYFSAVFIGFWLCGWAAGWFFAAGRLLAGDQNLFLIGWLGAWTVGGGAVIWTFWRLIRPIRPESVTLGLDHFGYDPGTAPPDLYRHRRLGRRSSWRYVDLFGENAARLKRPIRVAKAELGKFRIERVGERQRLTFDRGADRIEIGACLREPEREWLHATLELWRLS